MFSRLEIAIYTFPCSNHWGLSGNKCDQKPTAAWWHYISTFWAFNWCVNCELCKANIMSNVRDKQPLYCNSSYLSQIKVIKSDFISRNSKRLGCSIFHIALFIFLETFLGLVLIQDHWLEDLELVWSWRNNIYSLW